MDTFKLLKKIHEMFPVRPFIAGTERACTHSLTLDENKKLVLSIAVLNKDKTIPMTGCFHSFWIHECDEIEHVIEFVCEYLSKRGITF